MLAFFWAHEITNFYQAFFRKLFLNERMKDPIDFAISASAIKPAFGATSLYDVVF